MYLNDKRNIYFICKYATHPDNLGKLAYSSRIFILSYLLSERNYNVTLISSVSSGRSINLTKYLKSNKLFYYRKYNSLNHIILTGINISLGFNIKRIISWFEFEFKVFTYFFNKKISKNDIIYVSSLSLLSILNGLYLKFRYKCKLVFEIRDIWPLTIISLKNINKNNPAILILSLIEKLGYKYSDLIIGTMPGLYLHINSVINRNFNFHYLPQGLYLQNDLNHVVTFDVKNTFYFDNKYFYITYAGSIGNSNGVSFFFETAKYFVENKIHNFKFILIGDGTLKNHYLKLYNYPKNITLITWVNKIDLNFYLSNSNLLFYYCHDIPLYKYGISPKKFVDYMYSGRPIFACYNGFVSEIEKANCCFKIKPESTIAIVEKIIEISKFEANYLNMIGENGRKYLLKNLDFNILVDKLQLKLEKLFT
jgi:hypothetical protein